MANFTIKITSDSVCPWCFVGFRKLQRAMAEFQKNHAADSPAHTFTLTWHPFYLVPDAPAQSISKVQSYLAKFGPDRAKQVVMNLTTAGEAVGIKFSFLGKTGRTRDSHRLAAWAATPQAQQAANASGATPAPDASLDASLQTRVIEQMFKSYFENEEDITEMDVLATAAARAGLAGDAVTEFLRSDELGEQVDAEAMAARSEEGISGVPNFIINDRFEVSGAQDPAAFVQLFEKVLQQETKAETGSRMA